MVVVYIYPDPSACPREKSGYFCLCDDSFVRQEEGDRELLQIAIGFFLCWLVREIV